MTSSDARAQCPLCGAAFESEGELESHRTTAHSTEADLEKERQDSQLDEQLRESFPASDPPSSSPVTGVGSPSPSGAAVPDSAAQQSEPQQSEHSGQPRAREAEAGG